MTTSNSSEPVSATGGEAASASQTAPTSTPSTTSSAPEVKASESTPTTSTPEAFTPTDPTATQPQFQPSFKFKAFGKEHELEEFWRPLVKDQDSEKKVKDLFTRAYAFDDLKTRYEGTQQQFDQVYNDYTSLDKDVRRVTAFLNRGDLDNFFRAINLDEQKIYQWVENKLNQESLPPEQKRALESQAIERQRLYELEMEKTEIEQQYQTQAVQARTMQLDMVLSRPEIAQAASQWDQRMGQIGAFRNLLIEEAQKAWFVNQQDLSAEQAAQLVLTKYGKLLEPGGLPQASMQTPQAQPQTPQVNAKPVIPAVQGRGTSPIKKSPKSIEDLKAMAKELGA